MFCHHLEFPQPCGALVVLGQTSGVNPCLESIFGLTQCCGVDVSRHGVMVPSWGSFQSCSGACHGHRNHLWDVTTHMLWFLKSSPACHDNLPSRRSSSKRRSFDLTSKLIAHIRQRPGWRMPCLSKESVAMLVKTSTTKLADWIATRAQIIKTGM